MAYLLTIGLFLSCSLLAEPPRNDDFANAIAMPVEPTLVTGTTTEATHEAGEPSEVNSGFGPNRSPLGTNTVWWKWTSPSNYVVKFATCLEFESSDIDTQLGVYTGNSVDALTEIASNDDDANRANGGSAVMFPATQGTTYYILIAGFDSEADSMKLYRSDATPLQLTISREQNHTLVSGMAEWNGLVSLQSSTNMATWFTVQNYIADGVFSFSEVVATNAPATFYRAVIY